MYISVDELRICFFTTKNQTMKLIPLHLLTISRNKSNPNPPALWRELTHCHPERLPSPAGSFSRHIYNLQFHCSYIYYSAAEKTKLLVTCLLKHAGWTMIHFHVRFSGGVHILPNVIAAYYSRLSADSDQSAGSNLVGNCAWSQWLVCSGVGALGLAFFAQAQKMDGFVFSSNNHQQPQQQRQRRRHLILMLIRLIIIIIIIIIVVIVIVIVTVIVIVIVIKYGFVPYKEPASIFPKYKISSSKPTRIEWKKFSDFQSIKVSHKKYTYIPLFFSGKSPNMLCPKKKVPPETSEKTSWIIIIFDGFPLIVWYPKKSPQKNGGN